MGIALFIDAKLYSEAVLYLFYVVIGFYGWYHWSKKKGGGLQASMRIIDWPWTGHLVVLVLGAMLVLPLGYFMEQMQANNPYLDAATTVFSFIASYMQARKILSSWYYWIVLNAISIVLYSIRELPIYAALAALYLVLSFVGWQAWRKKWG